MNHSIKYLNAPVKRIEYNDEGKTLIDQIQISRFPEKRQSKEYNVTILTPQWDHTEIRQDPVHFSFYFWQKGNEKGRIHDGK